jgi:hypothetical protein
MNWTETLTAKVNETYDAANGLLALCDDQSLGWKPATGSNWMTLGQLLAHIPTACGFCMSGFVTGEWPFCGDAKADAPPKPEDMLPPAEKMPAAKSVAEVRAQLAADRKMALDMIARAGETDLATRKVAAPWNPQPQLLGMQLLSMVDHLDNHKAQLFYYLKLQGKSVHTGHLYGM